MPRLLLATTVPQTLRGFLLPLAQRFRAQGYRVDAIARGAVGCPILAEAFDRVWDCDWSRSPFRLRNFFGVPARLRDLVERERYDLVHVHTPVAAFVTRWALRNVRAARRVIYTAHGFHFFRGAPWWPASLYRRAERTAGRWTDYLVVINREDERAALDLGIVPPDRLRYMPGIGVDTRALAPDSVPQEAIDALRRELAIDADVPLLAMVAEFNPGKRHRDALAAFARTGETRSVLAFAGEGPVQDEMKRLAQSLGVASRTRFLGFRRDVPTLLRAARATLLPSEREGLPRTLLESLSLGTPAIGTRIRGIADLLGGGRGLLVSVGDPGALSLAMRSMIDRPDLAAAMGRAGREAMADYDVDRILDLHEGLYRDALASLEPSRASAPTPHLAKEPA